MNVATIEHPQLGTPIAVYEYERLSGDVAFVVCRFQPKNFRPAHRTENGRWAWSLNGSPTLLYHLPRIEEALSQGETIWIVDGEKDADALSDRGVAATCCARAQGWSVDLAEQLAGARSIRIVADNDDGIGLRQAAEVRDLLLQVTGVASTDIEIVRAAAGKDAYDHLTALYGLDDFVPAGEPETDEQPKVVFEPLREFLKRPLKPAEALVGVARDGTNLLPRFGWVMPWGREGSGKTSVLVDLIFHACAGVQWLGYPITRALRIVCIINEGIPGGFQDKLRQKHEHWEHDGELVLDNLFIYASPWGEFSFRDEQMVKHARDYALDHDADYVALDPLHTFGAEGAGAPAETEAFKHVLRNFGLWDDLGVISAHHSNKSGMVSGDWARHPDTVFHLEKDGQTPATKFTLQKARPADPAELGVPCKLEWQIETLGFKRVALAVTSSFDENGAFDKAREALEGANGPLRKGELVTAMGKHAEKSREAIDTWIRSGKLGNLALRQGEFQIVLPGSVHDARTGLDRPVAEPAQTSMVEPETPVPDGWTDRTDVRDSPPTSTCPSVRPPEGGRTDRDGRKRGASGQAETTTEFDDDIPF